MTKGRSAGEIADKVGVSISVVAGIKAAHTIDYNDRVQLAKATERWAMTMAQVGVRRDAARAAWPRWQFAIFHGAGGRESVGVVDLIAVRKDHKVKGGLIPGLKRGDALEIVLIQVKGGSAAKPTEGDGKRLRVVKRLHRAHHVVLATWQKGKRADFYLLRPKIDAGAVGWKRDWDNSVDFRTVFG